jgi:nucleotide-binding universal stress UspA family protein
MEALALNRSQTMRRHVLRGERLFSGLEPISIELRAVRSRALLCAVAQRRLRHPCVSLYRVVRVGRHMLCSNRAPQTALHVEQAMKLERIIFPFDFSELSRSSLPLAKSLARDSTATLAIVYVHEPPVGLLAEGIPVASLDVDKESLKRDLKHAVPADPDFSCEYHILVGSPAAEIVRFAKENKADLIVMSTHGRRGLSHLLMGSVAEAVVRQALCPVLTMKPAPRE